MPDGGSTLILLGMVLCAIGGISRKLNLARCRNAKLLELSNC